MYSIEGYNLNLLQTLDLFTIACKQFFVLCACFASSFFFFFWGGVWDGEEVEHMDYEGLPTGLYSYCLIVEDEIPYSCFQSPLLYLLFYFAGVLTLEGSWHPSYLAL